MPRHLTLTQNHLHLILQPLMIQHTLMRLDGLNTTIAEPRTYAAEKDAIEPVKEDLNEPFEEDNCEVNVADEMK